MNDLTGSQSELQKSLTWQFLGYGSLATQHACLIRLARVNFLQESTVLSGIRWSFRSTTAAIGFAVPHLVQNLVDGSAVIL